MVIVRSRVHPLAYLPALAVFCCTMIPTGITALASTQLAVTNKRILGKSRRQRLSIPMQEVETVVVGRGIMGLLFGYGTLTISGNGTRVRFPGVIGAAGMKNIIDSGVDEALFGHLGKEATPPPVAKPAAKPAPVAKAETPEEPPRPQRPPPDPNAW